MRGEVLIVRTSRLTTVISLVTIVLLVIGFGIGRSFVNSGTSSHSTRYVAQEALDIVTMMAVQARADHRSVTDAYFFEYLNRLPSITGTGISGRSTSTRGFGNLQGFAAKNSPNLFELFFKARDDGVVPQIVACVTKPSTEHPLPALTKCPHTVGTPADLGP